METHYEVTRNGKRLVVVAAESPDEALDAAIAQMQLDAACARGGAEAYLQSIVDDLKACRDSTCMPTREVKATYTVTKLVNGKRECGFITVNAGRYGNYVSLEVRTGDAGEYRHHHQPSAYSLWRLWKWLERNRYRVEAKEDGYCAWPPSSDAITVGGI